MVFIGRPKTFGDCARTAPSTETRKYESPQRRMRRSDRATKGKQPQRLGFQRQVENSPRTIQLEQQLQAAVLRKEPLLVEEQIQELGEESRNSLELDVGFDPVTLEAELGKCSRSTPMLNEREVTGEELDTAKECLRSEQFSENERECE